MANDETGMQVCSNPDCRVAADGACVDGFRLDECPRYGHNTHDQPADAAVALGEPDDIGTESIQLMSADTLTPSQASGILRATEARVVAVLGPLNSGKTSLIASLYDLFLEGPVNGIEFARSRTLHAFERASHDVRSASRRGEPTSTRTPRGGVRFFHLEIGDTNGRDNLALLLGDRSGEEYREVADAASTASTFSEVLRADCITVLIDGERLLDNRERHNTRSEIVLILQALRDGSALPFASRLALVLTKLDAVQSSPNNAGRAVSDFDSLFHHLRKRFGATLSTFGQFHIAASPKTTTLKRGTGVPELLSFWLQPTVPPPSPAHSLSHLARDFARVMPVDASEE